MVLEPVKGPARPPMEAIIAPVRAFIVSESVFCDTCTPSTYKLEIVNEQDSPLKLKNGHFQLRKKDLSKAKEHFISFYKAKGKNKINGRVNYWKKLLNVQPKRIRIMELQNRWGSCTEKGNVNFHWKSIMTPLTIIDYIIAHELTHLIHPNHSESFWLELDKVMPDYHQRKSWLKVHGAGMDL